MNMRRCEKFLLKPCCTQLCVYLFQGKDNTQHDWSTPSWKKLETDIQLKLGVGKAKHAMSRDYCNIRCYACIKLNSLQTQKKLLLYRTLSAKEYCWSLQYGPNKISIAIPTSTTVFSHLQVQERQSFLQITNGARCGLRFPTSSLQIAPNVRKKSLQLTWRGDKSRHIFHIRRLLQKKHRKM